MLSFLRLFAVAAALLISTPAAAGSNSVLDVRVADSGSASRVTLELSGTPVYRAFTLPDPPRLVVDIEDAGWDAGEPRVGGSFVRGVRWGPFQPGTLRVVMDLAMPVLIMEADMVGGSGRAGRLNIDVRPTSGQAAPTAVASAAAPASASASANAAGAVIPRGRPPQPPQSRREPVIVIDPGHGGADPGAIGTSGVKEKDVTLSAARVLRDRLQSTGRYKVVMTRDSDVFIRLPDRVALARKAGADLFVSLHADWIGNASTRGLSLYTLSEKASDAQAAALAASENKADLIAGVDMAQHEPEIQGILLDLARRETKNLSVRFANLVLDEVAGTTNLLRQPHRFANFAVLRAPDVPSVLIELGYLSNRSDEKLLTSTAYQRQVADQIARAIDAYFERQLALSRL